MAQKNRKVPGPALNIYLTGFMCSGKTLTGRALARALGLPFLDSDELLEKKAGASIGDIIAAKGLAGFRKLESDIVRGLAGRRGTVIALGGGVYPSRKWKALLGATGLTVFLDCPWPELEPRLESARGPRPLLAGPWKKAAARAKELYRARLPYYKMADLRLYTAGLTPAGAAAAIKRAIKKNENIQL